MEDTPILLKGTVSRIIFPKGTNSVASDEFAIFSVIVTESLSEYTKNQHLSYVKFKGNVCNLKIGEEYKIAGVLSDSHPQYGDTYLITYISKIEDLSTKERQLAFISQIIGEKTANSLFEKYDNPIDLIKTQDIESLVSVKGIGVKTANKIIKRYEETKDMSEVYIELAHLELSGKLIKKILEHYKSPTTVLDIIKNTPYRLIEVDGIGFKKADLIALKLGISPDSPERVRCYFTWVLTQKAEEGQSYVTYAELINDLYDNLGYVPESSIQIAATAMIDSQEVITFDNGNTIALSRYYNLEMDIAKEIKRIFDGIAAENISNENLSDLPKLTGEEVNNKIEKTEDEQGFKFTEEQKEVIKMANKYNVLVITGGAGVGKSSTARGIINLYDNCCVAGCALSGKASVRLREATGITTSTIHKLLGITGDISLYNASYTLPVDLLIVDESTMINGSLFLKLLRAIPTGSKLIILGDIQQITPIGNCQVFHDLLLSNVVPIYRLTKPHRQALRSGIIPLSMKVAKQEQIFSSSFSGNEILGELKDMELIIGKDKRILENEMLKAFESEIKKVNNIMEVQIIVPTRTRGEMSCYNFNTKIQEKYNPIKTNGRYFETVVEKSDNEIKKYRIHKGDKVINTKNNYNCEDLDGELCPVFNGNMGVIENIDEDGYVTIKFDGIGEVIFEKKDCTNLELGYACTIHKTQGSGFHSTIIGITASSYIMNNCELLYTAITRAKKYCVLVGENAAIRKSIRTKEINSKRTFLIEDLKEIFSERTINNGIE